MAQLFQDSKCYAVYMVIFTIDNTGTTVFDFPFYSENWFQSLCVYNFAQAYVDPDS